MTHGTVVLKMAAAGMARRLVQTVVVFMVLATAAVVALTVASTPTLSFPGGVRPLPQGGGSATRLRIPGV